MLKTNDTKEEVPTIIIAQGLIDVDFIQHSLEEICPDLQGKIFCTKEYEEVIRFIPDEGKIIIMTGTYLKSNSLTDKIDAYTLSKFVRNLEKDVQIYLLSAYPPEDKKSFDGWLHKSGHATKEEILDVVIQALKKFEIIEEEKKEKEEETFWSFLGKLFHLFSVFLLILSFCFISCSSKKKKTTQIQTKDTTIVAQDTSVQIKIGTEIKNVKLTKNSVTFWYSEKQLEIEVREQRMCDSNYFTANFINGLLFTEVCYGKKKCSTPGNILIFVGDSSTRPIQKKISFGLIGNYYYNELERLDYKPIITNHIRANA